ncbi:hypothetical protein FQN49_000840 [Arthroderma sp. PD_2]|nr:hypothetical protein FQN49_000840 [Arthroderma sp. PD_2]
MFNFLKRGSHQLPVTSTDEVVPLRKFDNIPASRNSILYSTFVFDDALDSVKLRSSLESLIERAGWNKLAGRLWQNETGEYVYHIPLQFTKGRPPVRFHHVEYDMAMAEHPLASKLRSMKPSPTPAVMADPNSFRSLVLHPDIPTKLSHYLNKDEPQLGLVVVSFRDATLVTLSWPHTLFDALGFGELVHAWSLMLQGQLDKIGTPHDAGTDPLAELGCYPTEPYKQKDVQLSWLQMAFWLFWFVYEAIFSTHQSQTICLPPNFTRKIRKDALNELDLETEDGVHPFLSEGDVVSAWWARVCVAHQKNMNKLTNVFCALGYRGVLAQDLLPSNKPYLSNAVGMLSVLIPSNVLVSRPLSYAAAQIRRSLTNLRTRAQVEAYVALCRESKQLRPPMFGIVDTRMIVISNWTKAKLFDLDFSAAVIPRGTVDSSCRQGFPIYTQCLFNGPIRYNLAMILGKDADGNFWINGITERDQWTRIKEAILKDRRTSSDRSDDDD